MNGRKEQERWKKTSCAENTSKRIVSLRLQRTAKKAYIPVIIGQYYNYKWKKKRILITHGVWRTYDIITFVCLDGSEAVRLLLLLVSGVADEVLHITAEKWLLMFLNGVCFFVNLFIFCWGFFFSPECAYFGLFKVNVSFFLRHLFKILTMWIVTSSEWVIDVC